MAEPKPVLLDFKELFVERKRVCEWHRPDGTQLALSVSENLSEMTGRRHAGL
jgi:hypothetical protein